jgi:hypothetical protein
VVWRRDNEAVGGEVLHQEAARFGVALVPMTVDVQRKGTARRKPSAFEGPVGLHQPVVAGPRPFGVVGGVPHGKAQIPRAF